MIKKNNIKDFKISNIVKEIGETNVEVDSFAKISFENGFYSKIKASFKKELGNKSEIKGEKGSIIIEDTWLGSNNIIKINDNGHKVINVKNDINIYSYQIQNISKSILNNVFTPQYPGINLRESLLNMKIIDEWVNA